MNKTFMTLAVAASIFALPAMADTTVEDLQNDAIVEQEFASDEKLEAGFVTEQLNAAIAESMASYAAPAPASNEQIGRKLTKFASTPKFGGYFIGKYDWTDKPNMSTNGGFSQRLVRLYVDGTILGDFAYRIQVQTNNDKFHMKDFFVEWQKFKELRIKVGQFKRAFGMENPMNPWDVGVGDYSQLTKKLTGHNDYIGAEASNNGGRDQGVQIQGDLFPIGKDKHRLIHYQAMLANGQGINVADANKSKDILATLQFQPIKGLYIGAFYWTGNFTLTDKSSSYYGLSVDRDRWMASIKFDRNDWTFRAEYAYSEGRSFANTENTETDAWYATVGVPFTKWLKVYGKYDVYRATRSAKSMQTIYSVAPNIQLHKNLMLQLQYNYVHDRTLKGSKKNYNEVWAQTYVRF